jgi:hypothetical protein
MEIKVPKYYVLRRKYGHIRKELKGNWMNLHNE